MKLRALLALVVASVATLIGLQSTASAAPVAYPAAVCSTIAVSTTTPALGESIQVSGDAFEPSSDVKLVLTPKSGGSGTVLKTVRSDSQGQFDTTVTMPSTAVGDGRYVLAATSGYSTDGSCPADPSVDISLGTAGESTGLGTDPTSAAPGNSTGGDRGTNGGGTAFTGVDVLLLLVVALALVGGGAELVRRNRRRSHVG